MTSIQQLKHDWFNTKNSTTTAYLNDAQMVYFRGKSALVNGTPTGRIYELNDHIFTTLTTLGYTTGELNDRLVAFYQSKTGSSSRNLSDLEEIFYANNTYDFV